MALIGLVRVSTDKQQTQRQHDALDPICWRVFEEKISGKLKTEDRPGLLAALEHVRPGDLLTVQEVDRLGRNLLEGLTVLSDLFQRGIGVKVLEGIAVGEHTERSFLLDLALALAEDRRRDISRKTNNGLAAARARGRVGGRRPVVDADKRAAILDRRKRKESIRTIAAGVGVSIGVVHKTLTEAEAADQKPTPTLPPAVDQAAEPDREEALADVGQDDVDRDALFEAFEGLADQLHDGGLTGEIAAALEGFAGAFLAAWYRQDGDGDLTELTATARDVIEVLADYRHSPATPPGLLAAVDQTAALLPSPTEPVPTPMPAAGQQQARSAPAEPPLKHAAVPGLESEWSMTGDPDSDTRILWWQRDTRIGLVAKEWRPGKGGGSSKWEPRLERGDGEEVGRPVTAGSAGTGRYPSRKAALHALAATAQRRRREHTPHTTVALDGLEGWTLTQTQADHDDGVWIVRTPDGVMVGQVAKPSWAPRDWQAHRGDRESTNRYLRELHSLSPVEEADRGSDPELFRTRTAAALALACEHDPDLYDTLTTSR